ncbi:MAG: ABC transporter substrate-binding protein, partial [Pseudonocardiaceae bacterium]
MTKHRERRKVLYGLRRPLPALLALLLVFSLAVGCGTPGEDSDDNEGEAQEAIDKSKKVDVAEAGDVTLTVWDQEVRGGQRKQIETLNRAFQEEYPNVTIKRVAKSFEDLNTTLKQAASDDRPPDVVQANQGRPVMGQLVKGGLLRPLNGYAEAYGWADRYPSVLLDLNRFSSDAKQFGEGNLYGLSQMGEIVGAFYNKDKVSDLPATFEEFERALAEAKSAGEVPIAFGNLDKWPGIHEYETVQAQYEDKAGIRDFVFARDGASFATDGNEEAAKAIQSWAEK